jgi:hypothetical protein
MTAGVQINIRRTGRRRVSQIQFSLILDRLDQFADDA